MSVLLDVRGVSKSFSGRRVLGPVSFTLAPGEFCAVTGPSGSGKSTFLNLSGFLDTPDTGEIRFAGETVPAGDVRTVTRLRREKIGMIFQSVFLLPQRSVLENVLFRARYSGIPREKFMARALALLDQLGLAERSGQKARLLSGGEAQRVAIARALLTDPALLLADEPTGNLDAESAEEVMRALSDCAARGIGVLLVTHNPALLHHVHTHVECREGHFTEKREPGGNAR
ncbi:MAG: ABC transporter ATP-binding protein [Verrucomicrobia bacterium]|nr:ABC transporter ATP-binding protein [Verrucomicrobiota bacterium]MCH8528999.1 ABC transporter ATP-binding protein [Kiritimatiellia bacterium]